MSKLIIKAETRQKKGKLQGLRKQGVLPAVYYGFKKVPTPIGLDEKEFEKIWKIAGESTTVTLSAPGGEIETLIHNIQFDPVKGNPIHVDFLAIDINKAVQIYIPLEFIGVSDAVKNGLGILVKVLHEIEIEALSKDLPHSIQIDISKLKTIEDVILARDIKAPASVKILTKPEEIVASIAAQKEEVPEVTVSAPDLSQIDIVKKGKKEEEGEVAAPIAEEPTAKQSKQGK